MKRRLIPVLILLPAILAAETLELREAWALALEANPTEDIARARLEQAEARARAQRGTTQPRLQLEASGARIGYSDTTLANFPPGAPDNAELYDAGLQARWLLWDGGGRRNRIRAATLEAEAGASARDDSRERLLAEVASAFLSAQLARANLLIAENDREFQQRQLENSIRKEEAGVDSRTIRLNFEIRKLSSENNAIQQRAAYEGAMALLTALLGREPGDPALPAPEPFDQAARTLPDELPELADLWARAVENAPALRLAEQREQAADAALSARRASRRPEVSAFGSVAAERRDDPGFSSDDVGNTVGLQMSWDIWDGNLRKEQIREAEALLEEARAENREAHLQLYASLRQARSDYLASVEAARIAARTLELSKENRDLVELAFNAGRETLLRLNEAQRDFTGAELRHTAAQLQRHLSWIDLKRSLGGLRQLAP